MKVTLKPVLVLLNSSTKRDDRTENMSKSMIEISGSEVYLRIFINKQRSSILSCDIIINLSRTVSQFIVEIPAILQAYMHSQCEGARMETAGRMARSGYNEPMDPM